MKLSGHTSTTQCILCLLNEGAFTAMPYSMEIQAIVKPSQRVGFGNLLG